MVIYLHCHFNCKHHSQQTRDCLASSSSAPSPSPSFSPLPHGTSWYYIIVDLGMARQQQQTPSLLTPRPGEQVVVWSHAANITTNNNNKIVTTIIRLFRVDINRVPIPNTIICEWWASDTSIAGHHLPFLLWNQRYSVVIVFLVDSHRIYGVSNEQIHFLYIGYIPIYHKGKLFNFNWV